MGMKAFGRFPVEKRVRVCYSIIVVFRRVIEWEKVLCFSILYIF